MMDKTLSLATGMRQTTLQTPMNNNMVQFLHRTLYLMNNRGRHARQDDLYFPQHTPVDRVNNS